VDGGGESRRLPFYSVRKKNKRGRAIHSRERVQSSAIRVKSREKRKKGGKKDHVLGLAGGEKEKKKLTINQRAVEGGENSLLGGGGEKRRRSGCKAASP